MSALLRINIELRKKRLPMRYFSHCFKIAPIHIVSKGNKKGAAAANEGSGEDEEEDDD